MRFSWAWRKRAARWGERWGGIRAESVFVLPSLPGFMVCILFVSFLDLDALRLGTVTTLGEVHIAAVFVGLVFFIWYICFFARWSVVFLVNLTDLAHETLWLVAFVTRGVSPLHEGGCLVGFSFCLSMLICRQSLHLGLSSILLVLDFAFYQTVCSPCRVREIG